MTSLEPHFQLQLIKVFMYNLYVVLYSASDFDVLIFKNKYER